MSKRSQEKRQARSKEKKRAHRRVQGASPLSRLAGTAEETCECWMTCSEDERMVNLLVMRPVRGGETAGAFFLIDLDCIGLKDAFYRLNVDPQALREGLRERSRMDGMRVLRITLDSARRMLAGAMRWTRAHTFRMPADAERSVKILGGVGDIENADISTFGDEDGNLLYVGRQIDLVPRLNGITLEEFMDREDVKCVFHMGNETFDGGLNENLWDPEEGSPVLGQDELEFDETEQLDGELDAMRDRLKQTILESVRRWCISRAMPPHPDLAGAVDLLVAASVEGLAEPDEEVGTQVAMKAGQLLVELEDERTREDLSQAKRQLAEFADSFPSQEAFFAAMCGSSPES